MSALLRPCRGLSVAETMMRSKCSCSRRWWSASRYVRPRATRASTCTPCELAPCSIASSSGMPTAHAAGRRGFEWEGSGHPREERRHDRRVLCLGEADCGLEGAPGDGLAGEGEQDAPYRPWPVSRGSPAPGKEPEAGGEADGKAHQRDRDGKPDAHLVSRLAC